MTKEKKKPTLPEWPLIAEIRKTSSRAAISVVGVVSVTELSRELISLASHLGRVEVRGEELTLSVFENKTVEVSGKITAVEMGYAKHR